MGAGFRQGLGPGEWEVRAGVDYLTLDADGRVADLTVFLRPLKAVHAFNDLMAPRLGAAPPA